MPDLPDLARDQVRDGRLADPYQYVYSFSMHVLGLRLDMEFEAQLRMAPQKFRQQRHDYVTAQRRGEADPQCPCNSLGSLSRTALEFSQLPQEFAAPFVNFFPFPGEPQLAGGT